MLDDPISPRPGTAEANRDERRSAASGRNPEFAEDTLHRRTSNEVSARVAVEPGERRGLFGATKESRRDRKRAARAHRVDKHHTDKRVAFFHYSYYGPVFKYFIEHVLNAVFLDMGEPTRRTLEIGTQHSNDYVCAPFKHIMGAYIEALDAGADVLLQFTGPCRLGYYGELQESILRDMGYRFEMLNFANVPSGSMKDYIAYCKRVVNPHLSIPSGVANLLACFHMVEYLDTYNDAYLARAGFEVEHGSFERARKRFLQDMNEAASGADIDAAYKRGMAELEALAIDKPISPVRVGLVGEYFTAQDAPSNLHLEDKLLAMHVELARALNMTSRHLHYNEPNLRRSIADYVTYDMGPTSSLTIAATKRYMEQGFDGIVHLKSSGCTPEIDVMPVLQRLSRDYHVPVLFLSYDSQTSDTGLDTRLEAFYDMIAMRKAR